MSTGPISLDYPSIPTKQIWKKHMERAPQDIRTYIINLFPILTWVHRYNFSWMVQDAIAGITVGMLLVPQGIAYAKIANLDPQYGLYTSFVGATLYCFFGTSKDISIGPITVVSLLVGQAINQVIDAHPEISGPEVAVCLSLFAGLTTMAIGLIRLGILVDLISEPVIAGYMTGSALTISLGQWPKIFGVKVNTHQAPYLIIYNLLKHLKETKLDAAFGITSLVILYLIKLGGARLASRYNSFKKPLFFLGIMRSGLVVVIGTLISFIINRGLDKPSISIISDVPAGFDAMAIPSLNLTILKEASGVLPSIIIILILEHVSVAKSFGRMSDYNIDPNQEILAIGMSNIVGSFFGAYPSTGAFSRTAVMSRSGAKTPMAGVFSGAVVVLALYALTPAFYYIPESVLAAVVIHAVIDLMAGRHFLMELWRTSKLEFLIFFTAVMITVFMDVETSIYVAVTLSLLLMLLRLARPSVNSLSQVSLSSKCIYVNEKDTHFKARTNPLPAGVVIIRPSHSILYPNAGYVSEKIISIVKSHTRSGSSKDLEQPWNQPKVEDIKQKEKPFLDAIVFDITAVDQLDVTAATTLRSLKSTLDRYAGKTVEYHFCGLANRQVRHVLIESGFGQLPPSIAGDFEITKNPNANNNEPLESMETVHSVRDPMNMTYYSAITIPEDGPLDLYSAFHWDVEAAIRAISKRRKPQLRSESSITMY